MIRTYSGEDRVSQTLTTRNQGTRSRGSKPGNSSSDFTADRGGEDATSEVTNSATSDVRQKISFLKTRSVRFSA